MAAVLAASLIGTVPAGAADTATLVSSTVLPHSPSMDGVVRLALEVRNDTSRAWAAGDLVHLVWKGTGARTISDDSRRLGLAVPPTGTLPLTLTTLAPTAVGEFTLSTEIETNGGRLPVGAPSTFHLSGFLFKGRGNGHGLGMSQWGARGRSAAGVDYRKILAAYYQGTRLDSRNTSGSVRIALSHRPIDLARPWPRLFGALPYVAGPLSVDGQPQLSAGPGALLAFESSADGKPQVYLQGADGVRGAIVVIDQTLTIRSGNPAGLRTNIIQTMGGDFRSGAEQWRYAGTLRLIPRGGAGLLPVNVLPMEDYLKGVVPAEMPPYWGSEALKAQAVAARTYALRKIAARGGGGDFDLEGNEFDQAYSGLTEQWASSTEAVDATRGQVLTYGGQLIDALFMASGGGHTENSEFGFIHWNNGLKPAVTLPYLRGIADPLDRAPSWQIGPLTPEAAAQILRDNDEDLGDRLLGIDVLRRGPSGRILGVRLRGSSHTDEVSGPVLRAWFGLPDTLADAVGAG
ncbi:MAG: SpoIID/LytB domain-containing protein [Candidatus Dormibacteraeota bacterium]|nr:SpoIID/LytB domain-containing protein [Candidatus Dormibacteraeota bacterium]